MSGNGSVLLLTFARRGEEEVIQRATALLREGDPEAPLFAIGTRVSAPVLRGLGVSEVVVFGDGLPARAAMAEMRRRRPRTAAIVYCGPRFGGHLKLEALALLSGAPRIMRVLPEREARIGRAGLAFTVAGKSLQAACCLVAGAKVAALAWLWLRAAQGLGGGRRASGS